MLIKAALKVGAFASEILEILGLAAIAFGISLFSIPAGIIAAGLAAVFLGYVIGGEDE